MSIDWRPFVALVHQHRKFLLTSHVRPDCDCLGSELAMADILEALGKEVLIVNGHRTPPNLAFIDARQRIRAFGEDLTAADLPAVDVIMILDTSAWMQLGSLAEVVRTTRATKILIDHHLSADDLGAAVFKDTGAEATGRLVLDAADQLGVSLTPAIATALFAALATDTGWFRFSSTTSGTYRAAARLIEAGACPADIFRQLYEQDTLGRVRLRGVILSRLQSELEGRLAWTYVASDDFAQTGSLPSDTEDVINTALTIAGTQMAVILVEQASGQVKVSFRSRCHVDCSRLAERFGGGGHKAAAGATVPGPLATARTAVLTAVREALQPV